MVRIATQGKGSSSTKSDPSDCHDDWISEWKSCRTDLARFDGYLDGLRKQGFSFVTALLSATTLVGLVSGTVVTPEVKAAILIVTQGLVVALAFLEKEYRLMGEAIVVRARLLERQLNLAESDTISVFSDAAKLWVTDQILNVGFVVLTLALGCALLAPASGFNALDLLTAWPLNAVSLATLIAALLVLWSSHRHLSRLLDLEVDRVKAAEGDPVRFVIYSLYPTSRMPTVNWILGGWRSRRRTPYRLDLKLTGERAPTVRFAGGGVESGEVVPPPIAFRQSVRLSYLEGFPIQWDTKGCPAGLYRWTLEWSSPEWTDAASPWRRHDWLDWKGVGTSEHNTLDIEVEILAS